MAIAQERSSQTSSFNWQKILLPIAAIAVVIFFLGPILWQVLTSLKLNRDISAVPTIYIPSQITLEHYLSLFTRRPFGLYILNSAFVSFTSTLLCLALGTPAAYALARVQLAGKRIIIASILIVTLFPAVLLFLGLFEIVQSLN